MALDDDPIDDDAPETIHEALRCISEIAKLNFDQIEVTQMDSVAYEGVIDFITSAVPMIYSSLSDEDDIEQDEFSSSHYLH